MQGFQPFYFHHKIKLLLLIDVFQLELLVLLQFERHALATFTGLRPNYEPVALVIQLHPLDGRRLPHTGLTTLLLLHVPLQHRHDDDLPPLHPAALQQVRRAAGGGAQSGHLRAGEAPKLPADEALPGRRQQAQQPQQV